jgi:hypothetical protein
VRLLGVAHAVVDDEAGGHHEVEVAGAGRGVKNGTVMAWGGVKENGTAEHAEHAKGGGALLGQDGAFHLAEPMIRCDRGQPGSRRAFRKMEPQNTQRMQRGRALQG